MESNPKTGFADRMETIAKEAGKRLYQKRADMKKAIGDRPYLGTALTPEQRMGKYNEMRNDPDAWYDFLKEHVRVKPDGKILMPKGMMKELQDMETQLREGTL